MDKFYVVSYTILGVLIALVGIMIYIAYKAYEEQQTDVERCFMQEPRTKECELVLYKYENRKKNTTTAVPVFMKIAR